MININNNYPETIKISTMADNAFTGLARTVEEEISLVSGEKTLPESDIIMQFGLSNLLEHELHTLSGGETVRTALAASMALKAKNIYTDCALEQLDDYWRLKVLSLFKDNHENYTAIITGNFTSDSASNLLPEKVIKYICGQKPMTIEIKDLSFNYSRPKVKVFESVNLKCEPGNMYFLNGENGSGKTTLVKILSGALSVREGSIMFGDEKFQPCRSSKRNTSIAFQNPDYQWTSMSVKKELQRLGFSNAQEQEAILKAFGIMPDVININPVELSFLLKKRLSIALAFCSKKPWIILDEPTLGQDSFYKDKLAELLKAVLKIGVGILIISHDTSFRKLFPDSQNIHFGNKTITNEKRAPS